VIEELTRKMNDAERTLLTQWARDTTHFVTVRGTLKWFFVWCLALASCGLVISAMIAFEINPIVLGIFGGPLALIAIICLYAIIQLWSSHFHWSDVQKKFQRHDVPEIERALEDGLVTVKKVSAKAVIEILEFEDEGAGYIFDLGDDRVLFLKGQRFFPVDAGMVWPNSKFELVRTRIGARWVGIFCHGAELLPVRTIDAADLREEYIWSEREEVVQADLQSFASRISTA
jgi:hypothetical protein